MYGRINGLISPFTGCAHALDTRVSLTRVFVTSVKTPRVFNKKKKKEKKQKIRDNGNRKEIHLRLSRPFVNKFPLLCLAFSLVF